MTNPRLSEYKAFEFLPGALLEIDLTSRLISYMSRIAYSVFGYTEEDLKNGILVQDIFSNATEFERALDLVKSFGLESYQEHTPYTPIKRQDLYDFTLKKKDGSLFYGECQGAFVLDEQKVPTSIRIYVRDLTEQRLMQAALHESEEKYRTLVESSSDMIGLFDEQGKILSVNASAAKALSLSPDELTGKGLSDLFTSEIATEMEHCVHQIFSGSERASVEITLPVNEQEIWVTISFNPVKNEAGKVTAALGVGRDITERKHAEEKIQQALIETENANRAKDQFLANMSHEFRTPLTSIIGFTDYLKKSLGDSLKPSDRESFDSIYRNSDRLLKTVNAILNFSQIQSGNPTLNPRIIYLNSFVKQVCDDFKAKAYSKGLEFDFVSETEDDKTWLDEYSMRQAIDNIVQNAIKYTREGRITVKVTRIKKRLTLIISDTGIGISADFYKQMFQPFSQESEGLEREYQGLGLGLALTKRYLEWNKVDIDVESRNSHGSSFSLIFPDSR